jgi:hypothetical protein
MTKKEKFLSLLNKIESRINLYSTHFDSKIVRTSMVREKAFLKVLAILMKNVLGIDFKKRRNFKK